MCHRIYHMDISQIQHHLNVDISAIVASGPNPLKLNDN